MDVFPSCLFSERLGYNTRYPQIKDNSVTRRTSAQNRASRHIIFPRINSPQYIFDKARCIPCGEVVPFSNVLIPQYMASREEHPLTYPKSNS